MVSVFRNYNPFGVLFLFFYGIILRFSTFLYPAPPSASSGDGFLYRDMLAFLNRFWSHSPFAYAVLAYFLVFIQAVYFNSQVNRLRLLPKSSYLPAMCYLLIQSLFPEWWYLSAALVANTLLVWIWASLSRLYNHPRADRLIFNAGLAVGIMSFFYFPTICFMLLIIFALVLMRPFRIREWVICWVGLLTPYYLLAAWIYLRHGWHPGPYLPVLDFRYPTFLETVWAWGGMFLLVIPFLISGYYIQANILRMLIQVRKAWSLLLLFLLLALLIPFINSAAFFGYWILSVIPFAAFHANTFFYSGKGWMPRILHWLMFLFILALNYLTIRNA